VSSVLQCAWSATVFNKILRAWDKARRISSGRVSGTHHHQQVI
jgi:hypothetical protein